MTIDTFIPIWRVDNGPVHGISFELCQAAKQHSVDAVRKGFPASFPSDLACANISYAGPDKTYNHVVSLAAGTHTLWTGLLMEVRSIPKSAAHPLRLTFKSDTRLQTSAPNQGWEQAWIEIVDTIGPLFPGVPEV